MNRKDSRTNLSNALLKKSNAIRLQNHTQSANLIKVDSFARKIEVKNKIKKKSKKKIISLLNL